jgi:hypothetical protein
MTFAGDLLAQAYHLANLDNGAPKQASPRRAVSTAYYALYHFLIDEAVGHWDVARQQSVLARTFDHGRMKAVCQDQIKAFFSFGQLPSALRLKNVALAFVRLQDDRHTADYNNAVVWSKADAIESIDVARDAFADWQANHT